jgi:protein SCO1
MKMLLFALLLASALGHSQPRSYPAPSQLAFEQRLAVQLPLHARFNDDGGRSVNLAHFFGRKPVVLVLGYYHCPNLCSTLMDGVLQTLASTDLPHDAYYLLAVSIDPTETSDIASRKKASYLPMMDRSGGDLHLLTGTQTQIADLAHSAGFHYAYDAVLRQYRHPAGFLVATPDGRISHYFLGVRFDPRDVRLALIDASAGGIGSMADRLLLLCSHYDPATGRYSVAAMTAVRAVCLLLAAGLFGWIWRQRALARRRT